MALCVRAVEVFIDYKSRRVALRMLRFLITSTVPNPIRDPSQLVWLVKKINRLNGIILPAGSFPANRCQRRRFAGNDLVLHRILLRLLIFFTNGTRPVGSIWDSRTTLNSINEVPPQKNVRDTSVLWGQAVPSTVMARGTPI